MSSLLLMELAGLRIPFRCLVWRFTAPVKTSTASADVRMPLAVVRNWAPLQFGNFNDPGWGGAGQVGGVEPSSADPPTALILPIAPASPVSRWGESSCIAQNRKKVSLQF